MVDKKDTAINPADTKVAEDIGPKEASIDYEAMFKRQQAQIDELIKANTEDKATAAKRIEVLETKLTNVEANTAEENALLGQKLDKISPKDIKSGYNPYDSELLYEVRNEEAKTTTLMGGDEVEGIVGLQEHITKKLKNGEKSFEKHPYKVKLIEKE